MIKMYCIFAKESIKKMNGNRGKLASQAGHAYLHAFWNSRYDPSDNIDVAEYKLKISNDYRLSERAYKITLVVGTVEELKILHDKYKNKCGVSLVTDAGFTVFDEPTTTCLGIGPINEIDIDDDIKSLKVLI